MMFWCFFRMMFGLFLLQSYDDLQILEVGFSYLMRDFPYLKSGKSSYLIFLSFSAAW